MLILNELLTDLANLAPVQIGDESIYYGAETDNASDDGIYVKLNLADFDTLSKKPTHWILTAGCLYRAILRIDFGYTKRLVELIITGPALIGYGVVV